MTINKALPTSFRLDFPLIPETESIRNQKGFTIYIIETVLPSITINPVDLPYKGGRVYAEGGGVEFGDWSTSFIIDDQWKNYQVIYDWMAGIYNGIDVFGRKDFSYQIDANLSILDNYEKPIVDFKFVGVWPTMLSEVSLSYQSDESFLSTSVTFKYDYFYKEQ